MNNILDVIKIGNDLKKRMMNKKMQPAILFIDLKKAYDSVPRDLLINKLLQFHIPCNIIKTINNMLRKFKLIYEGEKINTQRGLVQGSVLSPLLFNLFINDLMIALMINRIEARAYANDIVCIWETIEQVHLSIQIIKEWLKNNEMNINCWKYGIMRILSKKGKTKRISNELNFPEVESYCYLGVKLNQTLKLKEHIIDMRIKENIWEEE